MQKEEMIVNLLTQKGYHIACAESCTGGMVASRIVSVPNASSILNISFITYSNDAKIEYLDVKPQTLESFGAVSEQVVAEMATGVAKGASAEVGIGVSGIAGPGGATPNKPIGMVCFGIYIAGKTHTFTEYFQGKSRNEVRAAGTEFALDKLIELLKG